MLMWQHRGPCGGHQGRLILTRYGGRRRSCGCVGCPPDVTRGSMFSKTTAMASRGRESKAAPLKSRAVNLRGVGSGRIRWGGGGGGGVDHGWSRSGYTDSVNQRQSRTLSSLSRPHTVGTKTKGRAESCACHPTNINMPCSIMWAQMPLAATVQGRCGNRNTSDGDDALRSISRPLACKTKARIRPGHVRSAPQLLFDWSDTSHTSVVCSS